MRHRRRWFFIALSVGQALVLTFGLPALWHVTPGAWLPANRYARIVLSVIVLSPFMLVIIMYVRQLIGSTFRYEVRRYLRERGIPVCLHCGYSLRGLTDPRCPECAREFDAALLKNHPADGGHAP